MEYKVEILPSISGINASAWDALVPSDQPFVEHSFLAWLEESGCVGEGTAWWPRPVIVRGSSGELVAAAPSYLKGDSQGEYIFDHAWANGSMRAGIRYYPKVTVAVPFTPATGPRVLLRPGSDLGQALPAVLAGLRHLMERAQGSGIHLLFCPELQGRLLSDMGFLHRHSVQFHWMNEGYEDFEHFLASLDRKRRKEIRRERRKIQSEDLRIELRQGSQIRTRDMDAMWSFYRATHQERPWQQRYLNRRWFVGGLDKIGQRAVTVIAWRGERAVGGSLSFLRGTKLYGRYWGAVEAVDALHFECCYYRLIELAIAEKVQVFEAGAQGAHKLRRGFEPVLTHSAHLLAHPGLHDAVAQFVVEERDAIARELEGARL
ncbi:MAG: GNAT family N-acetyltransferase [Deltaproteobacteria bacterium]|nr:MAG: GNAT family N-acetyltransferase [Deltaproteobacteria bacterium]